MLWMTDWYREPALMARVRAAEDPGVPAYAWDVHGEWTGIPVSYVAAAQQKLPAVLNLDRLHRRVLWLVSGGRMGDDV